MSDKDQPRDDDAADAPDEVPASTGSLGDGKLEEAFFDNEKIAEIKAELEAEAVAGGDLGAGVGEPGQEVEGEAELQRILAPQRAVRHPLVAAVVIAASLFGVYWLWEDFRYFLRSGEPEDLGQASEAVRQGKLRHNTYVTLRGQAVPQTLANSKQKSLYGGARSDKVFWFVLKDTHHRVVVMARQPLIVDRHKPGPQMRYRPGIFTGRLRRLKGNQRGADIRRFYLARSRKSRELRQQYEFAAAELLKHVGAARATLIDLRGRRVEVKQDTLMEIKVAFPGEYELRVHSNMQVPLSGVRVQGGRGAPRCGPRDPKPRHGRAAGFGGSVFLRPDPKVIGFDELVKEGGVTAAPGTASANEKEPPVDGQERIVPIPASTVVTNAQKRDCVKACQWAGPSCKKACSTAQGVQIVKDARGLIPVAMGGACGGQPGERHTINLKAMPYQTAAQAALFVASLGHPYLLVEDASKSNRETVGFVVRLPKKKYAALLAWEKRDAPRGFFGIDVREEFYFVRWKHLKRRGSDLVITRTRRGFPPRYETTVDGSGRKVLAPLPLGSTLSIAANRVIRADLSKPLELPEDGFILEEGVQPSAMWSEPFLPGVPTFYLLLVAFIVFNLLAIRAHYRG